jgi:hypothetical protein
MDQRTGTFQELPAQYGLVDPAARRLGSETAIANQIKKVGSFHNVIGSFILPSILE